MNQAKKESVLLIECHPADAQLITNALNNDAQDGLQVENFKKLSEGLERIPKAGFEASSLTSKCQTGGVSQPSKGCGPPRQRK
jgi:hypothetical protein